MRPHINLTINQSVEKLEPNLPVITFPPKVHFSDGKSELTGYFVNYDNSVPVNDLFDTFKKDKATIVNSNSDFLLFYLDRSGKVLEIVSDQVGKFPLYFSSVGTRTFISSKFNNVVRSLQESGVALNIDLDGLLTGILWDWHQTEGTLVRQVKRLPAGCALKIDLDRPSDFRINSLVDLEGFLDVKINAYSSVHGFARDWVEAVCRVVGEQEKTLKGIKFGCDLSSGFDSTLVAYCLSDLNNDFYCYSRYSELTKGETDTKIMNNFARSHGLKLKAIDVSKYFRFQFEMLPNLDADDPYQLGLTADRVFMSSLIRDGIKIQFTGEGGDEIYASRNLDELARFTIQQSYFNNVMYLKKLKIQELFSKKALQYALSRERFNTRKFYPMVIPPSSGAVYWHLGEKYWDYDVWIMTPFVDTRLVQLARAIPKSIKGGMSEVKHAVLRQVPEIFDESMFQKKRGLENVYINFIFNQKDLIYKVLENSVLDELGIIEKQKIYELIENEKSILYTDTLAMPFYTMILLDWYFQVNKITR